MCITLRPTVPSAALKKRSQEKNKKEQIFPGDSVQPMHSPHVPLLFLLTQPVLSGQWPALWRPKSPRHALPPPCVPSWTLRWW